MDTQANLSYCCTRKFQKGTTFTLKGDTLRFLFASFFTFYCS